jgi:hypothetical protein
VSTPKLADRKHAYHGADTLLNRAVEEARLNRNLYVIALEAEVERLRESHKRATLGLMSATSAYREFAKGRDALYTTRLGDFERALEAALPREEKP